MDDQFSTVSQPLVSGVWEKLSPRGLEHRVRVPTAITFHRLVPKVSRTPRSHHKLAPHPYKHLDPEEIAKAQAKARLALLKAKLAKEADVEAVPSTSVAEGKTKPHESDKTEGISKKDNRKYAKGSSKIQCTGKQTESSKEDLKGHPPSRPKLPIYRGMGETNLRTRQIVKLSSLINDCLNDLDGISKKPIPKKDFLSPHEIEIKNRRWNEFLHSSGRMLFTLKHEVTSMERTLKHEERNPKLLRLLASSTRTLYRLLQALKTYSEEVFGSPHGKKLYNELLMVCHRLMAIAPGNELSQPKKKLKVSSKLPRSETEDNTVDSSELVISDVPVSDIDILQPDYVKSKLFEIASQKLQRKRKKSYNWTQFKSNQQKGDIILSPLKTSGKHKVPGHPRGSSHDGQKSARKSNVKFVDDSEGKRKMSAEEPKSNASVDNSIRNPNCCSHQSEDKESSMKNQMISDIILDEPKLSQQLDSVCKFKDRRKVIEETADEVINRLVPFLNEDHEKKGGKEPKVEYQAEDPSFTDSLPIENISQQLQLMLERVCKIEEEREQSMDVVAVVSRRVLKDISYPESDLQLAIDKAQNVLNNLSNNQKSLTVYGTHRELLTSPIHICNSENIPVENMSVTRFGFQRKNRSDDNLEEIEDYGDTGYEYLREEKVYIDNESIANQIKLQKEEFWASLVKRGFVKPHEIAVDGKTAAEEALKLLLKGNEDFHGDARGKHSEERIAGKKVTHSATNRREATLPKVKKEDKATLVTSLISSSSVSSENECIEKSHDLLKPEKNLFSEVKTSNETTTNRDLPYSEFSSYSNEKSNTDNSDDSNSVSFPSYDGRSISEN